MSGSAADGADDGTAQSTAAEPRSWTGDVRWADRTRVVGGVFLVTALWWLWQVGGPVGVAVWLVVAGGWLVFPPVVPVAIGAVGLVAVAPDGTAPTDLIPAAATLLAVLGADFLDGSLPTGVGGRSRQGLLYGVGYAGVALLLAGLVFAVEASEGVVAAAAGLAVCVAVAAYALYRYAVVTFRYRDQSEATQ